jgi:hypothetical protein
MDLQNIQKDFGSGKVEMDLTTAREQHHALITRLMTGPGGSEAAMHRAERLYGLSYWQQFRLRYRRLASPAFVERVRQAYLSTLEQSVRRDLENLKTQQIVNGTGDDASIQSLVVEAESLLARIKDKTSA